MSVRTEVETKLIGWASTQSPQIPVSVENVAFAKPNGKPYLQLFFLTPVTVNPDVAALKERETGIFQINVCVPTGTGTKAGNDLAQSIKDLFPVLPKTGTVSIERPPQISQGFPRDDGYWVVPISISYRQ